MSLDELIKYLLTPVGQIAIIMALAEMIKRLDIVPKKFIPLIDVVLGIISGLVVFGYSMGLGAIKGVILGLAIGLSACGLFSGIKNVTKK
jgi:hypothetical protein